MNKHQNTAALVLIALAIALGLTACGEPRQLNPGAPTAWVEVSAGDLDRIMAADHLHPESTSAGQRWALGACRDDGSAIYVWSKAPEWVGQHEFCHLVDACGGDWALARARLGAGAPACVDELCAALAHSPRFPGYQWSVLQDVNPHLAVILHHEKLALVTDQRARMR